MLFPSNTIDCAGPAVVSTRSCLPPSATICTGVLVPLPGTDSVSAAITRSLPARSSRSPSAPKAWRSDGSNCPLTRYAPPLFCAFPCPRQSSPVDNSIAAVASAQCPCRLTGHRRLAGQRALLAPAPPGVYAILRRRHVDVEDRREVEGHQLGEEQAADHYQAQRLARLAARAVTKCDRDRAQQRRHGGHHDGAETDQAALIDGALGGQVLLCL